MAKVRGYRVTKAASAATTVVAKLPPHENGDLLLVYSCNDYASNPYTTIPSGWTEEVNINADINAALYSLHATSSSTTNPTITATGAFRSLYTVAVAIMDCPSSSAIDVVGSTTATEERGDTHQITPTAANTLVLEYVASDQGNKMLFFEGNVHQITSAQDSNSGSGSNCILGWHHHAPASTATTTHKFSNDASNVLVAKISIAIKDDGNANYVGQVSPYTTPCELITPSCGVTVAAYEDAAKNVDPTGLITTIKGSPPTYKARSAWSGVTFSETEAMSTTGFNITSNGDADKHLVYQVGLVSNWDLSSSVVSFSCRASKHTIPFSTGSRYLGFGSGDSANVATAAKLFQFEAADTKVNTTDVSGVQTFCIAPSRTGDEEYSTLTDTAIGKLFYAGWLEDSSEDFGVGFIFKQKPLILINGSSTNPCSYQTAADFCRSNTLNTVKNQGGSANAQFFAFQDIQIGDGSRATYWDSSYQSIEYPAAYSASDLSVAFNVDSATFTHDINLKSGDTCNMVSSTCNMGDYHNWQLNSSTVDADIYDFTGCVVLNATPTVQAKGNIDYSGLSFIQCKELTHNSADLSGGVTISACVDTNAVTISGATQAALQTALDNFANCTFTNNSANAIRIEYTGTGDISLNFNNITFSGNVTADIHYNSTNSSGLTAVMQNGSNASTSAISGSATGVTISNDVTFTINITPTGAEVTLLETGTQTEVDHEETATTTYTYVYTYSSDQVIDIQVFKPGYKTYWSGGAVTLGNSDQTITVDLEEEVASQN